MILGWRVYRQCMWILLRHLVSLGLLAPALQDFPLQPPTTFLIHQCQPAQTTHQAGLRAFAPAVPSTRDALLSFSLPFTCRRRLQSCLLELSSICPAHTPLSWVLLLWGHMPLLTSPTAPVTLHCHLPAYSPLAAFPRVGISPSFDARTWPKPDAQ